MGTKRGKHKKKGSNSRSSNSSSRRDAPDEDMMNDEIDLFHKNRDVVSLNADEDLLDSEEDDEQPVLDFEEEEEEEDEDEDIDDGENDKGLAAKIVRTQKYLRSKFGGVDDEISDDADEEEEQTVVWGRKKDMYGADVDHEPQSSDDEDAVEEEREAVKLQREKAKFLSMEDFGLEDASQDETDTEPTFEELEHGKIQSKAHSNSRIKDKDETAYSIVKKDLNALTKEEQMDLVYSSAPELVGLLSELNDALEQLEKKVNPLVDKVRGQDSLTKGKMHYIEVKQLLLQSFCQAIAFYLLLKSEGLPVRDHPVVSRLVEIKSLLDKIKEMDANLPFDLEHILDKNVNDIAIRKLVEGSAELESDLLAMSSGLLSANKLPSVKEPTVEPGEFTKGSSQKHDTEQDNREEQVGLQSLEMLKIRASLEENLKKRGLYNSIAPKHHRVRKPLQPVNEQLETIDDFVDETMVVDRATNQSHSSKSFLDIAPRSNKRKVISGDDDIPQRDDIGERRRKHEMRVLAGAGIDSVDVEAENGDISANGVDVTDGMDVADGESDTDSDLEYYNQMERQHSAKLASKSDKYSRTTEVPSLPDTVVDGKRNITRQIEKNRGLTRTRKKLTKNPRKKYKLKHKKAEIRRKGQVRDIRKPAGPYGGEASGINTAVSRSIRFKN